jgi:hypothetical protein
MIAALDRRDPRLGVDVRVVPVNVTLDANRKVTAATRKPQPARARGGQPQLAVGDYFMVEVRNTGTIDAYVSVLDLSPDGTINPVWPHPRLGAQVQENKIRASDDPRTAPWTLIPFPYVFEVGPPAGKEILKAIATDVPADFSMLLSGNRRGSGPVTPRQAAAARTPVGRLLELATGTRRGGPTLATDVPDPGIWSAGSYTFMITPPSADKR